MPLNRKLIDEIQNRIEPNQTGAHTTQLVCLRYFLFDLLMTPAVLSLKLGMIGLLIPLLSSCALLTYIELHSRQLTTDWFVNMHWRIASKRSHLLAIGYAISAVLILIAWLLSLPAHEASMSHIMWAAMTRIALLPTLLFVMVTVVLEASSIAQASNGEVLDSLVAKYPPPLDVIKLV